MHIKIFHSYFFFSKNHHMISNNMFSSSWSTLNTKKKLLKIITISLSIFFIIIFCFIFCFRPLQYPLLNFFLLLNLMATRPDLCHGTACCGQYALNVLSSNCHLQARAQHKCIVFIQPLRKQHILAPLRVQLLHGTLQEVHIVSWKPMILWPNKYIPGDQTMQSSCAYILYVFLSVSTIPNIISPLPLVLCASDCFVLVFFDAGDFTNKPDSFKHLVIFLLLNCLSNGSSRRLSNSGHSFVMKYGPNRSPGGTTSPSDVGPA